MNKIIFTLLLFSTFSFNSFAQKEVGSNIIKINPLGALFGFATIGYEKALAPKSSIVIAPSFGYLRSGDYRYTVGGLGAEYRVYFKGTAPKGTYFGPGATFSVGTAKDTYDDSKTHVNGFAGKIIFGHQWIFREGFVLDLNGGLQYINFNAKDKGASFFDGDGLSGILPALGVSLGYNF